MLRSLVGSEMCIRDSSSSELLVAIEGISPCIIDSECQVALRNVSSQLSSGRQIQPSPALLEMKGQASALSVLLALASGNDPKKSLKVLGSIDEDLAEQLNDFHTLKNGQIIDWKKSKNAKGKNSLAQSRQLMAWQQAPDEASKLSSKQLSEGLKILQNNTSNSVQTEKIMWWRLNALHKEGKSKETIDLLTNIKLDHNTELSRLTPLLADISSDEIDKWLIEQIPILDDGALVSLIQLKSLSLEVRALSANNISNQSSEAWESVLPL